jgi:hypothetical protein
MGQQHCAGLSRTGTLISVLSRNFCSASPRNDRASLIYCTARLLIEHNADVAKRLTGATDGLALSRPILVDMILVMPHVARIALDSLVHQEEKEVW